jgi:hypothetical protein
MPDPSPLDGGVTPLGSEAMSQLPTARPMRHRRRRPMAVAAPRLRRRHELDTGNGAETSGAGEARSAGASWGRAGRTRGRDRRRAESMAALRRRRRGGEQRDGGTAAPPVRSRRGSARPAISADRRRGSPNINGGRAHWPVGEVASINRAEFIAEAVGSGFISGAARARDGPALARDAGVPAIGPVTAAPGPWPRHCGWAETGDYRDSVKAAIRMRRSPTRLPRSLR